MKPNTVYINLSELTLYAFIKHTPTTDINYFYNYLFSFIYEIFTNVTFRYVDGTLHVVTINYDTRS